MAPAEPNLPSQPRCLASVADHFRRRGESQNGSIFMPANFEGGMFQPSHDFARQLLANFDDGLKVLDIGCGVGLDMIILSGTRNQVWGIDIVEDRVQDARRNAERTGKRNQVTVKVMDAQDLQFPDNYFDLIFANSFLMWVNKEAVLRECFRVLKPGGRALFTMESMRNHPLLIIYRLLPRVARRERLVDRLSLHRITALQGAFSKLEHRQFYLVAPLVYPMALRWSSSPPVQKLVQTLNTLDTMLLRASRLLRRFAWISVLQYTK
jgi:ubiquinone/menaquinone biosynthesis C-methylase UbiE